MSEERQQSDITTQMLVERGRLRRRTTLLTLVPIVVGAGILLFSYRALSGARATLSSLEADQAALAAEIEELEETRAELERDIRNRAEALEYYEHQLPEEAALINDGLDASQAGEEGTAADAFSRALAINPSNPVAQNLLGYSRLELGEVDAGVKALRQAVALDPRYAEARYNLAFGLWAAGEKQAAAEELELAFELEPELRRKAERDPKYRAVRDYIEKNAVTATAATQDEAAFIERGVTEAQQGNWDAAVELYDRALEANPTNAEVLDIKGYALYRGKRYREAVVTLKRAVEESPDAALAHLNLGLALFRDGRRTEARAALDRAVELRPSLADDAQYRRTMRSLDGGQD